MNNYDIITVDHINQFGNDRIIDSHTLKLINNLKFDLLIIVYNVDILTINKYVEIYGSLPSLPYHVNSNLDKDRQQLKTISRSLKINKILKNGFNV